MPDTPEERAEALLLSTLDEEQRDEYARLRRFHVETDSRIYRIQYGRAGNVKVVHTKDAEFHLEALCLHPTDRVPNPDTMLAQKLLLEADEAEFRDIANITYIGVGTSIPHEERTNLIEMYLSTPDGRRRFAAIGALLTAPSGIPISGLRAPLPGPRTGRPPGHDGRIRTIEPITCCSVRGQYDASS